LVLNVGTKGLTHLGQTVIRRRWAYHLPRLEIILIYIT
jgi:hypothetical protein